MSPEALLGRIVVAGAGAGFVLAAFGVGVLCSPAGGADPAVEIELDGAAPADPVCRDLARREFAIDDQLVCPHPCHTVSVSSPFVLCSCHRHDQAGAPARPAPPVFTDLSRRTLEQGGSGVSP